MILSIAVMAHPERAPMVDELTAEIGPVPVSWDREGPSSRDPQRRWRTGRAAWAMADPAADWHLVLQDDAAVCPDFVNLFTDALAHLPDDATVVSPYLGTKRPVPHIYGRLAEQADAERASWIRAVSMSWGVAVAARTSTIRDMLAWCDTKRELPYDTRVGRWYRDRLGVDTWYLWPSIVDHRDGESLVGNGVAGRRAHRFHTGGPLRWDGPVVVHPRVTRRQRTRTRRQE